MTRDDTRAGHPSVDQTISAERHRLARQLHSGVIQQATALSLAIDSALLHDADGRSEQVRAALGMARRIADALVTDCRALLDELGRAGDP